jgi:hypothetical protein
VNRAVHCREPDRLLLPAPANARRWILSELRFGVVNALRRRIKHRNKEGATMMSFSRNFLLGVAACAIAAGTAAAQNYEAEIPFAFRAGTTMMAPGRYHVWIDSTTTSRVIRLLNEDSRQTMVLLPAAIGAASDDTGRLQLRFHCDGGRCSLAAMSVGGSAGAYTFHAPRLGRDDTARVADIALKPVKAAKGD